LLRGRTWGVNVCFRPKAVVRLNAEVTTAETRVRPYAGRGVVVNLRAKRSLSQTLAPASARLAIPRTVS